MIDCAQPRGAAGSSRACRFPPINSGNEIILQINTQSMLQPEGKPFALCSNTASLVRTREAFAAL